jgi:hypothetical protein
MVPVHAAWRDEVRWPQREAPSLNPLTRHVGQAREDAWAVLTPFTGPGSRLSPLRGPREPKMSNPLGRTWHDLSFGQARTNDETLASHARCTTNRVMGSTGCLRVEA